MIIKILDFLVSIPAMVKTIDKWASQIASWWISRQNKETFKKISEAAANADEAKTKEDRINAVKKWKEVLSRPRYR